MALDTVKSLAKVSLVFVNSNQIRFLYYIQSLIVSFTLVLSFVIYSGYIFDIEYLYRPVAGGPATHELTVFTVFLIALSLLSGKVSKRSLRPLVFASLAGFIAVLRIIEIISNVEIVSPLTPFSSVAQAAINQGLSHEMGLNTAFTILSLSVAIIFRHKQPKLAFTLGSFAPAISSVSLSAYTYEKLGPLYGDMSLMTIALILPISFACLIDWSHYAFLRKLYRSIVRSRVFKVQLLLAIVVPWFLGLIFLYFGVGANSYLFAAYSTAVSFVAIGTIFYSVNAHRQFLQKLELSSRVFMDAHEAVTITDKNKLILDVNPAFTRITGYRREDVIGKNASFLDSGKQSSEFYKKLWRSVYKEGTWKGELWNKTKQGEFYAEKLTIKSLKNKREQVTHYLCFASDITESKQQLEQLEMMAHYDVLTKLPNRTSFIERFYQSIAHAKQHSGHQLAVCFLDIDNFKLINDNYGYAEGDRLLIEIGRRISECIKNEDMLSRQSGDEFAILLDDIESISECERIVRRIHKAISEPYLIDQQQLTITASSGVTLYPIYEGDIDTLLRHADIAMYQSKRAGKNRYYLHNIQQEQEDIDKWHSIEEIELALSNNEFQLYYQPKVNMVTGDVFGVEALIRWFHPDKGLIPPLDFLPLIDHTEVELKIGQWVINQSLEQLEHWHGIGIRAELSINISSFHLLSDSFLPQLDASLAAYPAINSQDLQLEILESSMLGDVNAITKVITTCRNKFGVNFALDDFGTGYSSLTHLRNLPATTIKMDQSFVRDMLDDPDDYAIIDSIIGLANSFERQVIAEGVETPEHGLMLGLMGCELAQGYAIARPMPGDQFPQWLADYSPNKNWLLSDKTHTTDKEKQLMLFSLVSNHWQEMFISNIQASLDTVEVWPILDSKRCHCGKWLERSRHERLFELEDVERLVRDHEAIHLVANDIFSQYQEGDIETARSELPKLKAAFDRLSHSFSEC